MLKYLKKLLTFNILTLIFLIPFSCQGQKPVSDEKYGAMLNTLLQHSVKEISVDELEKKIITKPIILDAREKKEFSVSHIRHAKWIGYNEPNFDVLKNVSKFSTVIVYCSVGYRSEKITEKIKAMGYNEVYNLYGGVFEWFNQGNPLYNSQGRTSRIHAFDQYWGAWIKKGEKVY